MSIRSVCDALRVSSVRFSCALAATFLACACTPDRQADPPEAADARGAAMYVGGQICAGCHAEQHARWTTSHHAASMAVADASTVLADFDDQEYIYNGVPTRFFMRDGEYWVNTDGPDGALQDFRVTHTFGFTPLQQYLIELPGGRRQALSIAWDTRPASEGGQRWFHLYPGEAIDSEDPLHWTGTYQNWNTMCAECHSTDVVKNFDPDRDVFDTTWSSINVDCESCHGPGSAHVEAPLAARLVLAKNDTAWVFVEDANTARRQPEVPSSNEIEVCAQCHSRRGQLTDDFEPGDPFLDGFRPALLEASLYYADGQILDEVYVYGSFLQSKMYAAGVTCSNCHEPHSEGLKADGNALCGQCHLATVFDTPAHHHHSETGPGARCINCHMRARNYMVVDPRRDHSFRVPRPDLTRLTESPNACQDCHAEQAAQWAADQISAWYPSGRATQPHYGEALHAGRTWSVDRAIELRRVIEDGLQPAIVRATAIGLLAQHLDDAALDIIERQLDDDEPIVQLAAIDALEAVPATQAIALTQRFLDHELRALRIAAARHLLPARPALSDNRRADLDAALEEYLAVQRFGSDRAEGLLNRGSLLAAEGRQSEAEATYRLAIEREPAFVASYVNLADLYRAMGREQDGASVLRDGLAVVPGDPNLMLSLGFSLVRSGEVAEALTLFERAAERSKDSPFNAYVLGVAQNSVGDSIDALQTLQDAHERFPGYPDILVALITMHRDAGNMEQALELARQLTELSPADPSARALLTELETVRPQ
jgi:predicted CXXCH cytochrome family protein